MSGKLGLSTRKINWHFRTHENQNDLDQKWGHTGSTGVNWGKMMIKVEKNIFSLKFLGFRVEPFGLNELWILHIFNTLGADAEFSNTRKRPNPRPNSKLTLLNYHIIYRLYSLEPLALWTWSLRVKAVCSVSEIYLNEILTFVMLNRWIVKINIVFDFSTWIPRKLYQIVYLME